MTNVEALKKNCKAMCSVILCLYFISLNVYVNENDILFITHSTITPLILRVRIRMQRKIFVMVTSVCEIRFVQWSASFDNDTPRAALLKGLGDLHKNKSLLDILEIVCDYKTPKDVCSKSCLWIAKINLERCLILLMCHSGCMVFFSGCSTRMFDGWVKHT